MSLTRPDGVLVASSASRAATAPASTVWRLVAAGTGRTGSRASAAQPRASRFTRAEASRFRHKLVATLASQTGSATIAARSAPDHRTYVSWTTSSASAAEPSSRYARPKSRARCSSNSPAGPAATPQACHSLHPTLLARSLSLMASHGVIAAALSHHAGRPRHLQVL